MSKRVKIILSIVAGILLVSGGLCWYAINHYPITVSESKPIVKEESLDKIIILSKDQINEDREKMIELVEDIHPYFLLEKNQNEYETAKETYTSETQKEMSISEFEEKTSQYLNVFHDGHTRLDWKEEKCLDINWTFNKDGLYLYDQGGLLSDKKVTEVNHILVDKVFETIDRLFPAENEMSHAVNYSDYSKGVLLLSSAGIKINDSVTLTLEDNSTVECKIKNMVGYYPNSTNTGRPDGNIYSINFNSCVVNDQLENVAKDLKAAIKDGVTKVIIDVRENGGGDSNACVVLLEAMGMKAPDYSGFIRYSKEASEQRGYLKKRGSVTFDGNYKGKKNKKIHLVVLTNRNTFSSATMMAVFVRDGGLGTIIGEASSNNPCSYGDILMFQLPNSKLSGSISHKRFLRPDNTKYKENILKPDIEVDFNQDAYKIAVDWLNKNY